MIKLEKAFEARNKKLNKIEKLKELREPKEAFESLEQYAKDGYDSIPKEDKDFFLKCFGIYDRPKTPKQFMLKLRIPSGYLTSDQAQVIGECAKEFGNDYLDLTTRTQCELRYLDIQNIPTILKRLDEVGINSYQTGVDNIRGVMGDPFDDMAFDNVLPSHQLLLKIQNQFLGDYKWIGKIPRKFNFSITGNMVNRCNVFVHDCCFILAMKDGVYGYNMYLGGKVGKIAKNADIFLKDEEEVLKAANAIATIFKDYGFKDNRNKNRLMFLIEAVGIEEISSAIRRIAEVDFDDSGETMTKIDFNETQAGKIQLRDGSFGVHLVIPSGIFKGSSLIEVARLSKEYGNSQIRFDMEQSLYILGVKNVDDLLSQDIFKEYKNVNTPYFNNMIACAGTEHCPFGVIENKNDAIAFASFLSSEVPLENAKIRFYWSACVKGCGIHGLGDIGFEGCKAKLNGQSVSGVNISLGGKLVASEAVEGHTIIRSAPISVAKEYIKSLMLEYKELRVRNENFELFNDRVLSNYTNQAIGFILKLNSYLRVNNIEANISFNDILNTNKIEQNEILELGKKLYFKLSQTHAFTGEVKKSKPTDIRKLVNNCDENIAILMDQIFGLNSKSEAMVFSELDSIAII